MSVQDDEKAALRRRLLEARRALEPTVLHRASEALATRIAALPAVREARTVALYQALRNEIEMQPLWRMLAAAGKQVLFPRVRAGTRVLAFAPVDDPGELSVGSLGIREPPPERDAPLSTIDVFVVPALGFDRQGLRLGRGGGYYDATLAARPEAFRIGPCLEILDRVPGEEHDQPVDLVITPAETIRTPRPR